MKIATMGSVEIRTAIIARFGVTCARCVTSAESAIGNTRRLRSVVATSGQMNIFHAVSTVTDT